MNKGLIELLRQSEALIDRGDSAELMNSGVWDAAVCGVTRLVFELRGINQADIAQLLQSELDRLESGVEDGAAGQPEFRRSPKYRRWSAYRRLVATAEGVDRRNIRSPGFLDRYGPGLIWLTEADERGLGDDQWMPSDVDSAGMHAPIAACTGHAQPEATSEAAAIPVIHTEKQTDQFGGPKLDLGDDRIAWWLGKRIYLGSDTQLGRLFWLLARPVGAVRQLAEVQCAVDGFETNSDYVNDPKEIARASARVRKTISRLRKQLREAELDEHLVIVRDGPNEAPTYSMVMRHNG